MRWGNPESALRMAMRRRRSATGSRRRADAQSRVAVVGTTIGHTLTVVSLGPEAGPHSIHLTHDDKRLVVTDYFLHQGTIGKVALDGDHKVRVLDVKENRLEVAPNFEVVDFNTAFATGRARPHGVGMK
jgi:DNA-binding beta-propeller fold protein YncE